MPVLKKGVLFIDRKISRLREGGLRFLLLKVKTCLNDLCLNIFAPLAVVLRLDWPSAYFFVGKKFVKKFKGALAQAKPDLRLFRDTHDRAIAIMQQAVARTPKLDELQEWLDASKLLHGLLWIKTELGACRKICDRIVDVRRDLAEAHQLDRMNIVFLPRFLAFGALGAYEYLCTYIKAEELSGGPVKQKIILVDPKIPVNNYSYLNYWRRYVTVITDPALIDRCCALEKCLTLPLSMLMPFRGKMRLSNFLSVGLIRECWEKEGRPPLLTLSAEDAVRGQACLRELGVPEGAWFVAFHVREGSSKDKGGLSEDFRNADIGSYLSSMAAITAAGGWVIRMGDPAMQPLTPMKGVIDYAHSSRKSDWMDVFLCARSRFFVGTSSGPYTVAMAFGVPVVATNYMSSYTMYCLTSKDIVLPRICWSRSEGRYLSFHELISPPVGIATSQRIYDELGLDIIPNTAEEITEAVIEMSRKCEGSLRDSEEDALLHRDFRAFSETCSLTYGDEKIPVNARVGTAFLRKHAMLLDPARRTGRVEGGGSSLC